MPDHVRLLHEENADLSAFLHTLTPEQWDAPSLCESWRVRDVVGHLLYGNEVRLRTLPLQLARARFSPGRVSKLNKDAAVARAEGRLPAALLADFDARGTAAPWQRIAAPIALLDRVAHHQDIRRPLHMSRTIPEDRLVAALQFTPRAIVIGATRRSKGLRFRTTDIDWAWGDGPEISGPGEALLMAMLGREEALGDLGGEGLAKLRERLLPMA